MGGEMISLPAIENALLEKYGSEEQTVLAIEGTDSLQTPRIVLFSTISLDLNEVNLYLKQSGFSNLIKINRIIQLDEIPLLGTGKTDYKVLKNMI
jgi:long-chain-fatty-acid--[acyl-carrier-protein] ligase